MSRYFKYFRIPFVIVAILIVVCLIVGNNSKRKYIEPRDNDYYDNTACVVYDWADKLTDEEEAELSEAIFEWQEACSTDIIWITMDEAQLGYLSAVKEYANRFNEDSQMGYYGPGTNAIVFVDNWSRGGDGGIHTWLSTTGEVRNRISDDQVDEILYILDEIPSDDADPYEQYMKILYRVGNEAYPYNPFPIYFPVIAGVIAAAIFILVNWRSKLGDKTITNSTYLEGGAAQFPVARDIFNHKTVTKHKIESSSGGGGGGGGSHGGGGHSR